MYPITLRFNFFYYHIPLMALLKYIMLKKIRSFPRDKSKFDQNDNGCFRPHQKEMLFVGIAAPVFPEFDFFFQIRQKEKNLKPNIF